MTQSAEVIEFIETFITIPEGRAVGKPMLLMDWQKDWLKRVFDNPNGTRRAILSVARKNSKSSLVAAIILAYVVGPLASQNAQVFSAAQSREQASLVFNLMAKMVRMHPDLAAHVVIRDSAKELLCTLTGVRFRALSADAATALGTSPVCFVYDEIGQVIGPHCALFDALHSGQGAHAEPIEFIISTQSASDADFFSVMVDDARTGSDPRVVIDVFEAPADCDLMDETGWKAANPALGQVLDIEHIRGMAEEAVRLPAREPGFRNLILNQRCEARAPFVSRSLWMKNAGEVLPYAGGPVYGGLDLSSVSDLTCLTLIYRVDGVWQVQPYFWTPQEGLQDRARRDHAAYDQWVRDGYLLTTPGASVDFDYVAEQMLEICSDFDVQKIAFDRWRIDVLKASLVRRGAPESFMQKLELWGQGFQSMSPAIDAVEAELLNGRIAHGGHPVLQMCAANAVVLKDPAGNRKLDKMKSTGRIDGMQALCQAMGVAARGGTAPKEPQYQMFILGA